MKLDLLGTLYFVGTAGSGKSTLVDAYKQFLDSSSINSATVNMDPAVVTLPYNPDFDIRDYVSMKSLLESEPLGPNGAIIAAMDIAVTRIPELAKEVKDADPDYVLVDTPGQLELFVFRAAGPLVVDMLTEGKKASCFLMDPLLADDAASLASLFLFSASTSLRLGIESINVMSKADKAPPDLAQRISEYIADPSGFYELLTKRGGLMNTLSARLVETALEVANYAEPVAVSSYTRSGIDFLHASVQRIFSGGEVEEPGGEEDD
ncbi:MAG: ATP/GTP-binding protein [Thermoprotei archaeon]